MGDAFPSSGGEQNSKSRQCLHGCSTGVWPAVDSSYITVTLIKYMVIPTEGILISWVRSKLFSLLLQMKTSTRFCRESMSLADGLAQWSPPGPLQPHPLLLLLIKLLPRVECWG